MQTIQKDILFYSKFCNHCNEVIAMIMKANIRNLFIFVSVDENKYNIPPFVTHVPTIVTKKKEILKDGDVISYLTRTEDVSKEISPFSLGDDSYSSSFTFLTENGYDVDGIQSEDKRQFVKLTDNASIYTPPEADTSTKSNKFDDSIYERYINGRNADDEVMKRPR
jgi:hypothetical protein